MMRGSRRIVSYIGIAFVTLLAWSIGLTNAQSIQQLTDIVELRYDTNALTGQHIKDVQKGEGESKEPLLTDFLAWRQVGGKKFENQELNKRIEGDVVEVYGNTALFIPMGRVNGQMIDEGNHEGVIVTEAIAQSLWGSLEVIGKTLTLEEKNYSVRGILEADEPYIIMASDLEDEDSSFTALRMQFVEHGNVEGTIHTMKLKYNLPDGVLKNLSLTSILLSQLALLPGVLLGLYGLFRLYKFLYKTHRYWVSALILGGLSWLVTWIVIQIVKFPIDIPDYIIPNQWSDFDFWANLVENMIKNQQELKALPFLLPDHLYSGIQMNLVGGLIIACIGGIALCFIIKVREARELFWGVLTSGGLSFLTSMLVYQSVGQVALTRAFWAVIPIYLLIDFVIRKWKELLEHQD